MATTRRDHLFITEHLRYCELSDQDVADELNVNRETVWRWQNEQHRLNPQKIRLLADLCGVEPGELWHLPGRRSIDALLRGAPADLRTTVEAIVQTLLRKKPTD